MKTDNFFSDPDRFYDELSQQLGRLNEEECAEFQARLVLILANQVGDADVLSQCLALAAATAPACAAAGARAGV